MQPGALDRHGLPAGIVTRAIAGAVDYAVIAVTVLAIHFARVALRFLWNPVSFHWPRANFALMLGAGAVLMLMYLTVAWSTSGRTWGGAMMSTRVVTPKGNRLGLGYALARAAFTIVFPIGLFWCALPERRSVQDMVLRTRVLYDYPIREHHDLARTRPEPN